MDTPNEYQSRRVKGVEACAMLGGITRAMLNRLVRSGRLPACRVSKRTLTIKVSDIEAFLEANKVRPAEAVA
jgi:hypothetical protein